MRTMDRISRTTLLLACFSASSAFSAVESDTVEFEAPKYGVRLRIPKDWEIAVRERDEYILVGKVPQADPDRPGAVACELGLAPESLDEYRTRIDTNARKEDRMLSDTGLRLRRAPREPHANLWVVATAGSLDPAWEPYLPAS